MDKNERIIMHELSDEYSAVYIYACQSEEPFDKDKFTNSFVSYMKDNFSEIDENYNLQSYVNSYLEDEENNRFEEDDD